MIITLGLPGAGKSTRALRWVSEDPARRARVGSDQIGEMLHPHAFAGDDATYGPVYAEREQLVVNAVIEALLRADIDVVCDDPFLLPRYLDGVRALAERCGADLIVWDMTDVSEEECIARDQRRGHDGGRSVGAEKIRRQAQEFRKARGLAGAEAAGSTRMEQ
ncbi:AAA family ATPase [Actinoplanes sp. CA-054009]